MSEQLYANNATTTISTGLNTSVTLITVASGTGALFPSPTAGQFFVATLVDAATGLFNEIVYVTARTGDAMTVIRAQEGTLPRNWLVGDTFANFWTAGSTTGFFQGQTYAGDPNGHVAGNAGGAGGTQGVVPSTVWDTVNGALWFCTTTGSPTTAVWQRSSVSGIQYYCGTSTGTANAQVVTAPGGLGTVVAGTAIAFLAGLNNTGAATLTIGTLGTFGVYKEGPLGPTALTGGEIVSGNIVTAIYDGTRFQITSTSASSSATSVGFYVTSAMGGQTLVPGKYLIDTSGGAFTMLIGGSPVTGQAYTFVDIANNWATNIFSLDGNGQVIGSALLTVSPFNCNITGLEFTIEFNGSYWNLVR